MNIMYYSPADIVRYYLITVSDTSVALPANTSPGSLWPLYVSSMPTDIDNCAAIYDMKGMHDGRSMDGTQYMHPGISFRFRADDYPTVWNFAYNMTTLVDTIMNNQVTMPDGTKYNLQNVTRMSDPIYVEEEKEKHRVVMFFNALTTINYLGA